ncbi:unnamed protein product [Arctogadus glacialis]
MFRLNPGLCCLLLLPLATANVFVGEAAAKELLVRRRRANSMFEELRQGNLERECIEERCDREEAREIYEDKEKTDAVGGYSCFCQPDYQGFNCEIAIPGLCESNNGGCDHFCRVVRGDVRCSCTDGYFLSADQKACHSNETFMCGAVFHESTRSIPWYDVPLNSSAESPRSPRSQWDLGDLAPHSPLPWQPEDYPADGVREEPVLPQHRGQTRIVGGDECPPGECPWQALLLNEEDRGFCGGTILNRYMILTAAHCMNQSRYIYVILGTANHTLPPGSGRARPQQGGVVGSSPCSDSVVERGPSRAGLWVPVPVVTQW